MYRRNEKENASCVICDNKYYLCIACERNKSNWKPWKIITDTENCFKIYDVLNKYNFNKISKEEAKEKLGTFDLSGLSTFKESVKKQIEEILEMTNNVETVESIETTVVDIVEKTPVEEVIIETNETAEEIIEENNIEVVEKKFRKRTSKKNEE